MIVREDMNFHIPEDIDYGWGETTYFDILIPEANIHAWVYLIFRAGIGAVMCDVTVVDRTSATMLDAVYVDIQNHLPLPERMELFTLPNGFSLDATDGPRNYRVDYIGVNDTELHFDARGIMEPFDIHDPKIDPMAVGNAYDAIEKSGFGSAYSNHFDLTCHVVGTLKVRGRAFPIDCIAAMDHSWGPRAERGMRSMCWMNANFSAGMAMQAIWSYDLWAPDGARHEFKHGYAVVNGEIKGAVKGSLSTIHDGLFTKSAIFELVDQEGTRYLAEGIAQNSHLWTPYGCCPTPTQTMKWTMTGQPTGIGTIMEGLPIDFYSGWKDI